MKFYAVQSYYGSETSFGFANDKTVYVFSSKKHRDEFVRNSRNISTHEIVKSGVINYARNCGTTAPKKGIGCDDHWCIRHTDETDNIDGCIGLIDTYYGMYQSGYIERFYK
jgi:hypothetical protein